MGQYKRPVPQPPGPDTSPHFHLQHWKVLEVRGALPCCCCIANQGWVLALVRVQWSAEGEENGRWNDREDREDRVGLRKILGQNEERRHLSFFVESSGVDDFEVQETHALLGCAV